MENGAWPEGLNYGNEITLSTEKVELEACFILGSDYMLYMRLFG